MAGEGLIILLEQITALVQAEGTWQEKRDQVLQGASTEDKEALAEFASWFHEH